MYLKQGKKYECIKQTAYRFIVGQEYLAVTPHQLLDIFAVPFDVTDWDMETFERYFKLKEGDEKVNHPEHYNQNGIECFDVISAFFGKEALEDFCLGNA